VIWFEKIISPVRQRVDTALFHFAFSVPPPSMIYLLRMTDLGGEKIIYFIFKEFQKGMYVSKVLKQLFFS